MGLLGKLARRAVLVATLLGVLPPAAVAQIYSSRHDDSLSQREVDTLRDTAYEPARRVVSFVTFMDDRSRRVQDLLAKPRHAGRELDLHDLYAQMADIADELNDNLDEYAPLHRDLRKSLPKLIDAAGRWQSVLRAAPPDERYDVARKLALTAIADADETAKKLLPEQETYFKEHPEAAKKEAARSNHEAYDTDAPPPKN